MWWCQPTHPRVSYSSSPHSPLAFWKSCSIDHRFDRMPATAAGPTDAGALVRWYFTSGSWPSDRRTSSRSGPLGNPSSLNHTRTSAYSYTSGPWLPSATATRRHADAGNPATTSSTRTGLVATRGLVVSRPRAGL